MSLPNIEEEDIEDICFSLIYPFIAILTICVNLWKKSI